MSAIRLDGVRADVDAASGADAADGDAARVDGNAARVYAAAARAAAAQLGHRPANAASGADDIARPSLGAVTVVRRDVA